MPPQVSVIIPVYNAEAYIAECAQALFSQTLTSLEYIFIDDNTPDNSINILQNILRQYPHRKPQVKILRHTTNQGVSASRQHGTTAATGEYIIHCDPDDHMEPDMYQVLYHTAKSRNADIVLSDFITFGREHDYYTQQPRELTSQSLLASIAGSSPCNIHGATWNKLVRNSLYKSIHFPPGINYCEDLYIHFLLLAVPRKIAYVPRALYHYRIHPHSLAYTFPHSRPGECLHLISVLDHLRSSSSSSTYRDACAAAITALLHHLYTAPRTPATSSQSPILPYLSYIPQNHHLSPLQRRYLSLFLRGHRLPAILLRNLHRFHTSLRHSLKHILFPQR